MTHSALFLRFFVTHSALFVRSQRTSWPEDDMPVVLHPGVAELYQELAGESGADDVFAQLPVSFGLVRGEAQNPIAPLE